MKLQGVSSESGGSLGEERRPPRVFHGGRAPPLGTVRVLKMDQDRATVSLASKDGTGEVNLGREGSEWRVELPPIRQTSPWGTADFRGKASTGRQVVEGT